MGTWCSWLSRPLSTRSQTVAVWPAGGPRFNSGPLASGTQYPFTQHLYMSCAVFQVSIAPIPGSLLSDIIQRTRASKAWGL
ncbi:hypothetical protein LshimejAT787_1301030 [Lyophyllum shimeji]|uniref:Uncharacterized protein n=1 Tax=Lyophyllum shimeji TaxID=47721 RepID=A0A9P3PXS6_LYOSH|nr:hypothetical protein LshimejAT787_1301030 [Lyophyllum shimeji]